MLSNLLVFGEVHASISMVAYSNSLSTSDDSSSDVAETLLPFILEMAKTTWGISVDPHVGFVLMSNDSSSYATEICFLIHSLYG